VKKEARRRRPSLLQLDKGRRTEKKKLNRPAKGEQSRCGMKEEGTSNQVQEPSAVEKDSKAMELI